MLNLSNVTLLCVETREPELAHWAIDRCLVQAQFANVVLLTDLDRVNQRKQGIEYVQAPIIKTTKDYSDLLLTGIGQFVFSSHVLVIQWDSFIVHPQLWSDDFLQYDYIGSVWPHHPQTPVGNGGFSLRSKKLLEVIQQPGFVKKHPEDYCICAENKEFLDEHGILFAPVSIAEQFSVERSSWHEAFGFHGFFNFARILNDAELKRFIEILPENYLNGIDAYELIDSLREQGRVVIAKEIAKKVRFKWKMRKHFVKLKFWLLSA